MKGARVKIARRQNCIRGLNCKKKNEGSILHEDKFARGDKVAQRKFCTEGQFCTNDSFVRRVILKSGTEISKCIWKLKNNNIYYKID